MFKSLSTAIAALAVAGCAAVAPVPEAAKRELAPTGKLRAGMNLGNALFTKKAPTGELHGVAVDLMEELGRRLGVPVEMVVHATPGDVADAAGKNTWDVAILAIAAARAQSITFSPPITEIEASYVVHKDSPLQSASQVDAAGVRIVAPNKAGYELYLTQTLKHATLVRSKGFDGSIDVFNKRGAEALAGLKPAILDSMHKMPDGRILDGRFMTVNHGLSTPRGRAAADEYLKAFVADVIASGFVARSIERHNVAGLSAVK
jgi:polar amino acid transport system substrate-binding protein